jgi:ABC-type sugar transport system permease subunit
MLVAVAEMSAGSQLSLRVVVLLIAVSVPIALAIETGFRQLVLLPMIGPELHELREFYWPALTDELRRAALTRTAWVLVGVTVLAGALGVALLRRAARRERDLAELRDRLLLLTSIPQVPAILATLCFAFGSSLLPVLISMAISTAFVLAQGLVGERLLGR